MDDWMKTWAMGYVIKDRDGTYKCKMEQWGGHVCYSAGAMTENQAREQLKSYAEEKGLVLHFAPGK